MFPMLFARICCCTSNRVAGDLTLHDAHAGSLITMLQKAISVLQMISSPIKVFGYFFCSQSWHAVQQIVKRMGIAGAMMLVCRHCNDNVAKRDFSNGRLTHWQG